MKIAVIGSRYFTDYKLLCSILDKLKITHIVSGAARGADSLGVKYAKEKNIPYTEFPADWSQGLSAGNDRNWDVVKDVDLVVAFNSQERGGTGDAVEKARKLGKRVLVIEF